VAALLASPDEIIATKRNTIQETGDMTDHAEMVLLHPAGRRDRKGDPQSHKSFDLKISASGQDFRLRRVCTRFLRYQYPQR
jgi:tRNA(Arg) A34 adenosine deaminase TadA